jgi:hypothetical protein
MASEKLISAWDLAFRSFGDETEILTPPFASEFRVVNSNESEPFSNEMAE